MTNEEINILTEELNKQNLFKVLKAEKGGSAETILSKVDLKNMPNEMKYEKKHILKLLDCSEVDYYNRYDYHDLQNLIKEDNRIRINFWASKILEKPVKNFKIPQLINKLTEKEISNIKSNNFTLLRTEPVKVKNKEEEKVKAIVMEHPIFLKKKLTEHENNQKVEKLLAKNFCKVSNMEAQNDKSMVSNMILLRNYNVDKIKQTKTHKK